MALGFKMGASGEKPRTETYNVTENGTFDMGAKNLYRYVNVETGKSVIIMGINSDITINYADYGITIPDGYAPLIIPIATYLSGSRSSPTMYFESTPSRTSASIKVVDADSNNQVNILLTTIKAKSWGSLYHNTKASNPTNFTIEVPMNKLMVVPIASPFVLSTYTTSLSSTQSKYTMVGSSAYSQSIVRSIMYYEFD